MGKDPTYVPYYPGDADLGLEMVAPEGGTTHLEVFHKVPDKVIKDKYTYYEKMICISWQTSTCTIIIF